MERANSSAFSSHLVKCCTERRAQPAVEVFPPEGKRSSTSLRYASFRSEPDYIFNGAEKSRV
jgi:hypothetical protein